MKQKIIDDIRKIKYFRMKPEEKYILNIIDNLEVYTFKILPYVIIFKIDDEIIFEYSIERNSIRCNDKLWDKLEKKFKLDILDVHKLFRYMVKDYLINIDDIKTKYGLKIFSSANDTILGLDEKDLIKMDLNHAKLNDYILSIKEKLKKD